MQKFKLLHLFKVSGTAALTGLMKAYETASNKQIPEEVKKSSE